jgi:CHAT domain-containing protein
LHKLPFAALRSKDGRYLVEDHPVGMAPSANLYFGAIDREDSVEVSQESSVLVVANPEFDRSRFPRLSELPGASDAADVARLYGQSEVLEGSHATKERFLASAGNHHVVHFAGHALSSSAVPLTSQLLLASGADETGALYAHELFVQRFPRTRVVILAACQSLGEGLSRTEGVGSLAAGFLAAGVPSVVATLWSVEDETSSQFSRALHEQLAAGQDALRALRSVQIQFIESGDETQRRPASWAAFVHVGGHVAGGAKALSKRQAQLH